MVISTNTEIVDKNSIDYQVQLILKTDKGSVPMMRDYGIDPSFVDRPILEIESLLFTEIYNQIKKYVPGVVLKSITTNSYESNMEIKCEVEYE